MQGDALSVSELVVVGHQYGGEECIGRIGAYGRGGRVGKTNDTKGKNGSFGV